VGRRFLPHPERAREARKIQKKHFQEFIYSPIFGRDIGYEWLNCKGVSQEKESA
jgi:hypothetical protein